MHDRLYELGFTEAAANFQQDNFNRGGYGNDPVLVDVQNNANCTNCYGGGFSASPNDADQLPARIELFLWKFANPWRDGAFDAEIIIHEYTHLMVLRRVGAGAGIVSPITKGLAEGWCDFYAMALLSEQDDDPAGVYPYAAYSCYLFDIITEAPPLDENYYFGGLRAYPISTDMSKNPLTYKDIDHLKQSPHSGIPRNPQNPPMSNKYDADCNEIVGDSVLIFPNNELLGDEHFLGEVWCAALWEVRANLIAKHGFHTGNELSLQLAADGMVLCPPNPNFLQARDALLLADQVMTGGANQTELWQGFAKRGMGWSASEQMTPFPCIEEADYIDVSEASICRRLAECSGDGRESPAIPWALPRRSDPTEQSMSGHPMDFFTRSLTRAAATGPLVLPPRIPVLHPRPPSAPTARSTWGHTMENFTPSIRMVRSEGFTHREAGSTPPRR